MDLSIKILIILAFIVTTAVLIAVIGSEINTHYLISHGYYQTGVCSEMSIKWVK